VPTRTGAPDRGAGTRPPRSASRDLREQEDLAVGGDRLEQGVLEDLAIDGDRDAALLAASTMAIEPAIWRYAVLTIDTSYPALPD
jgi:hypothetical protein